MPATAEPTASFPDMRPRTVHDEPNQTLDVYVVVSMSPDGKVIIAAPSLAILKGDWTVRWILVHEADLNVKFADVPIEIGESGLPPRVIFPVKKIENFQSYCTGPLSNNVDIGANHFKYFINVEYTPPNSWIPQVIHHDPTIAVTPDPITQSRLKPTG